MHFELRVLDIERDLDGLGRVSNGILPYIKVGSLFLKLNMSTRSRLVIQVFRCQRSGESKSTSNTSSIIKHMTLIACTKCMYH